LPFARPAQLHGESGLQLARLWLAHHTDFNQTAIDEAKMMFRAVSRTVDPAADPNSSRLYDTIATQRRCFDALAIGRTALGLDLLICVAQTNQAGATPH